MEKKMVAAALLLAMLVLSCSNIKIVESGPEDCIDACSTGCVTSDPRRVSRCEGKCRIKCGPGVKGNGT